MKEKLEKIREACIKANPEIVELKFGCLVTINNPGGSGVRSYQNKPYQIISARKSDSGEPGSLKSKLDPIWYVKTVDGEEYTGMQFNILGREIQLADVLMLPDTEEMKQATDEENAKASFEFLRNKWDLSKPLSGQSEETVDFIFNLLK